MDATTTTSTGSSTRTPARRNGTRATPSDNRATNRAAGRQGERSGSRRARTGRKGDAPRYAQGRDSGPAGGMRIVPSTRPVCERREGRPVVLVGGDATLTPEGATEALRVGDRHLAVDTAAAGRLCALDGELRWMSRDGAVAQQAAVELGIGRWPTSTLRSVDVYGTLACDDVAAQLAAEPTRALVWVDRAELVAERRASLEAQAASSGTPLLVVAVQGRFGDAEAAQVMEFLAVH